MGSLKYIKLAMTAEQTFTAEELERFATAVSDIEQTDIVGTVRVNGAYADVIKTIANKCPDLVVIVDGHIYIRIDDAAARALILAKYDLNNDGYITQDEADRIVHFNSGAANSNSIFSQNANILSTEWIKNFPNLTTMTGGTRGGLFWGCTGLVHAKFPVTDKVTLMGQVADSWGGALSDCTNLESCDTSEWDTSNVTSFASLFRNDKKLTSVGDINVTSKCTNLQNMFASCSALTALDCSEWVTDNVTRIIEIFNGCSSLTSVGDLSGWNVGNVTMISNAFKNCPIQDLSFLSHWNPSKVTNIQGMLYGVNSPNSEIDLSGWTCKISGTGLIGGNNGFFNGAKLKKLSLKDWDISAVTSFVGMGSGAYIEDLDLRGWDTINCTSTAAFGYAHIDCLRISGSWFNANSRSESPFAWASATIGGYSKQIHIYDAVPYLPTNMLNGISTLEALYIHDELTPPSVSSLGIRAAAKIYVPAAAVNDYKAAWPTYASQIVSI